MPRSQRPAALTIQPRYQDMYRQLRAEYCRMRPSFRGLAAVRRKMLASGELGVRLPTLETLAVWARGGLNVPGCWESGKPWDELAALVDSRVVSLEQVEQGTQLVSELRQLMEESLKDPAVKKKLVKNPALLMKFAQVVGGEGLTPPVLPKAPAEPRGDSAALPEAAPALEQLSDEELRQILASKSAREYTVEAIYVA